MGFSMKAWKAIGLRPAPLPTSEAVPDAALDVAGSEGTRPTGAPSTGSQK